MLKLCNVSHVCGQLPADGGADVIKIEPLIGDDARRNDTRLSATEARQYLNKNRGTQRCCRPVRARSAGSRAAACHRCRRADCQFSTRSGVPCGPVLLKDQVLDDEQAWANDYLVRMQHDEVGGMTVVAPPPLGKHTCEVLAEAGVDDAQLQALQDSGAIAQWGA